MLMLANTMMGSQIFHGIQSFKLASKEIPTKTKKLTCTMSSPPPLQSLVHETVKLRVERFYLPELHCSIPVKRHPDYESIREIVDPWMLQWLHPMTEHEKNFYLQSEMTGKVCMIIPESTYKEKMLALSKFIVWLLYFDDMGDDTEKLGADATVLNDQTGCITRALDGQSTASDLGQCHIDIILPVFEFMRADMSPRIFQRHVNTLKSFISSMQTQTGLREASSVPDLPTFIQSRRLTVAFLHMQLMVEYCLDIELDDETLQSHYIQDLHYAAMDFIAWFNDVLSFRREYYSGDLHNLPSILYFHHGGTISFQEAVCEACEMIKQREADFLRLLQEAAASDLAASKPEVGVYLRNLPYCLSGLVEWFYASARFHGPDHVVGEQRHGFIHMHPHKTIITPTPIFP